MGRNPACDCICDFDPPSDPPSLPPHSSSSSGSGSSSSQSIEICRNCEDLDLLEEGFPDAFVLSKVAGGSSWFQHFPDTDVVAVNYGTAPPFGGSRHYWVCLESESPPYVFANPNNRVLFAITMKVVQDCVTNCFDYPENTRCEETQMYCIMLKVFMGLATPGPMYNQFGGEYNKWGIVGPDGNSGSYFGACGAGWLPQDFNPNGPNYAQNIYQNSSTILEPTSLYPVRQCTFIPGNYNNYTCGHIGNFGDIGYAPWNVHDMGELVGNCEVRANYQGGTIKAVAI